MTVAFQHGANRVRRTIEFEFLFCALNFFFSLAVFPSLSVWIKLIALVTFMSLLFSIANIHGADCRYEIDAHKENLYKI